MASEEDLKSLVPAVVKTRDAVGQVAKDMTEVASGLEVLRNLLRAWNEERAVFVSTLGALHEMLDRQSFFDFNPAQEQHMQNAAAILKKWGPPKG